MRYFVHCKLHNSERIYVNFSNNPRRRTDLPAVFMLNCPSTSQPIAFYPSDVSAEGGPAPIGGAIIGGLLFLVDPVLGLLGALLGAGAANNEEQQQVNDFNNG